MAASSSRIKRVAINTGGGDAPGLNAVIRAATLCAINRGWECWGIRDGYNGLFLPDQYPDGGLVRLTAERVRGIAHLGGTMLGTTNKGNPFKYPTPKKDGTLVETDRSDEIVKAFRKSKLDALIAIGGDGSLTMANDFAKKGLRVIGVPKTIDNDLDKTVITFGFDTAVSFATECIDRLHSTAQSHRRTMIVEVMGRYAGWIALNCGISGGAHAILMPEIPYDIRKVADKVASRYKSGRNFAIVVVAEGALPKEGTRSVVERQVGRAERLGGVGERVAKEIEALTKAETRVVVLGHLLRGGSPTSFDRLIGLRFGAAAVRGLAEGQDGVMVALDPPKCKYVPLAQAVSRMKAVPLDSDSVLTARELGIAFGD
jgi:ATP-dependent phosphofructokinase / diphosphate-dependent phosphofructokinase